MGLVPLVPRTLSLWGPSPFSVKAGCGAVLKQQRAEQSDQPGKSHTFSHREMQVISLIGEGRTTKEMASSLNLAPATISSYRKSICRKLNVHSTAELIQCVMARFKAGGFHD